MKTFTGFFIVFLAMTCWPALMKAQDVTVTIPTNNIFNRTEYSTVKEVLYTNATIWKGGILGIIAPTAPTMKSTVQKYTQNSSFILRDEVLLWQLTTIGGNVPGGGTIPGYKYFTTSNQTWFQPALLFSSHSKGAAVFSFKIPTSEYTANAFRAGNYGRGVTQNYDTGLTKFTPASFNMIISVPADIKWIITTPSKTFTISDLAEYRSTNPHLLGDLGVATIGNTVDFNLHGKGSSSLIQFTSSKGVTGTRAVSYIKLGSTSPKLNSLPLSSIWQNYTASSFEVEIGNRNSFTLQLSIAATDFKAQFYQAGTYTFQLNLDTKSTDNTISALQNTDVTIEVEPLSEISIPSLEQAVNFEFNTAAHYNQGRSQVISNQIKLSNNDTFELYVKSDSNFFKKAGVQTDINANILEIGVDGSASVSLSTTPQKIITAGTPVLDQELDIKYNIPATAAQSLIGKEKTTYSINVIYSFTAI